MGMGQHETRNWTAGLNVHASIYQGNPFWVPIFLPHSHIPVFTGHRDSFSTINPKNLNVYEYWDKPPTYLVRTTVGQAGQGNYRSAAVIVHVVLGSVSQKLDPNLQDVQGFMLVSLFAHPKKGVICLR